MDGNIVVVTVPLRAHWQVLAEPVAGKVVIDTTNYYPGRPSSGRLLTSSSSPGRVAGLPGDLEPGAVQRARPLGLLAPSARRPSS